jgi:hypothetical protein
VQRWLQHASDRLHACRNAAHTGFQSANTLRWRMLGLYGWGGMWIDEWVGRGLFYQTPHPANCSSTMIFAAGSIRCTVAVK